MLNNTSEKQDLTLAQLGARIQHFHDWLHQLRKDIANEPTVITPDDMEEDRLQKLMIELIDECITEHECSFQSILCFGGIE